MADANLNIKIKAAVDGLDQLVKLTAQLQSTLGAAATASTGLNNAGGGMSAFSNAASQAAVSAGGFGGAVKAAALGIAGMNPAISGATAGVGELKNSIGKLVGGLIALAGLKLSFDGLKDMADIAARAETLGVTLGIVANNAGYSKEEIDGFETTVKKLGITTTAARDSLTRMIQAGIPLGSTVEGVASNVSRLARAAQDLAVVTGENSSNTFQRLITNIQQMDTMGLRFMGITVSIQGAQQTFAASLGKTTDQLTQQQKVMATTNAVLREAAKLTGAYEASMETVGKKLTSMARFTEELSKAIGDTLLPVYGAAVDSAQTFLKASGDVVASLGKSKVAAESYGEGAKSAFDGVGSALVALQAWVQDIVRAFSPLAQTLGEITGFLFTVAGGVIEFADGLGIVEGTLRAVNVILAALIDGLAVIGGVMLEAAGLIVEGYGLILEASAKAARAIGKDGLAKSLDEAAEATKNMGGFLQESGQKLFDPVINGTGKVAQAVNEFGVDVLKMQDMLKKIGNIKTASDAEESIRALTKSITEGTVTSVEAGVAIDVLRENITNSGKAAGLTEKQVSILLGKLGALEGDRTKSMEEGFRNLGFSAKTAATGISEAFSKMQGGFEGILATAPLDALAGSFTKVLAEAKNLSEFAALSSTLASWKVDIDNLKAAASQATDAGNIEAAAIATEKATGLEKEFGVAIQQTARAYDEIASKTVSAATTQQQLGAALSDGKTQVDLGMISWGQYANTIELVRIKSEELERVAVMPQTMSGLKSIGLSFTELTTGVTAGGQTIKQAFEGISSDANLTGTQVYNAFTKGLGLAKTLEDLTVAKDGLDKMAASGKITGEELASAGTKITVSFDAIFKAALGAAKSREDFAQLTNKVTQLGKEGTISAEMVESSMLKIKEAATGATDATIRLVKQQTELATSALAVSKAQNEVEKARLGITQAETALTIALTQASKDGTAISRADVEIKRTALDVAKATFQLSEAKLAQEISLMKQKAAQQQLINALKAQELNPSDKGVQAGVDASKKLADAEEKATEAAKQRVLAQEQNVAAAEKAAIAAEREKSFLEGAAVAAKDVAVANTGPAPTIGTKFANPNELIRNQLKTSGFGGDIDAKFKELAAQAGDGNGFGMGALRNYWKAVEQQVEEAKRVGEEWVRNEKALSKFTDGISQANREASALGAGLTATGTNIRSSDEAAQKLADAMRDAQIQAAGIAKSAAEGARSFISSMRGIHEELLTAQGKDEDALASRIEGRRQELDIQFQQLQLQVAMARIQATAAGVSTATMDAMFGKAQATYERAKSDLSALGVIEKDKLAKDKADRAAQAAKDKQDALRSAAEKAAQDAKAVSDNKPQVNSRVEVESRVSGVVRSNLIGDRDVVMQTYLLRLEQEGKITAAQRERLLLEKDITNEFLKRMMPSTTDSVGGEKYLSSVVSASAGSGRANAVAGATSDAVGAGKGYIRPIDMHKVTIEIGGKSADVFTPQGQKEGLMDVLQTMKKRA